MIEDLLSPQALHELMARIAAMYYQDDMTQEAIAQELGLSRQKVQRLLRQARAEGIVEIRVHTAPFLNLDLEARLKTHFSLKEVVVASAHADAATQREQVSRSAANFLERRLHNGMVIAVGMGRNTGGIPAFFRPTRPIDCAFISAMGGSPGVAAPSNPNDICRGLAARCRGRAISLYAPAYVENVEMRDRLIRQEAVHSILQQARRADMAFVGIGDTDEHCTLVRMGCFSVEEVQRLRSAGAVGDILGNYFDLDGRLVNSDLFNRLVGLSFADLHQVQTVVGVASEREKTHAILGALRTGVLDVLIIDAENARAILELADGTGTTTGG